MAKKTKNEIVARKLPYGVKKTPYKKTSELKALNVGGRPLEWDEKKIDKVAVELEKWFQDPENYYFEGFLNQLGIYPEYFTRFCERSKRFREAYARAKGIQEQRIVSGSMNRTYDGNFAKFVLANKAGWKEKTEVSGDSKNPLHFVLSAIDGHTKDIVVDNDTIDYKED